MLVFISNWITFVRETFHKNTLVRHFFIITDTYVTNIQNNKNTVMTEKEKEAVRLPENAFRELKDGEEYRPVMNPQRQYPEVNAWSVTWGILMAIVFSAAAAYLGLRVGQVFEAAIPIAIIAVGVWLQNATTRWARTSSYKASEHVRERLSPARYSLFQPYTYFRRSIRR